MQRGDCGHISDRSPRQACLVAALVLAGCVANPVFKINGSAGETDGDDVTAPTSAPTGDPGTTSGESTSGTGAHATGGTTVEPSTSTGEAGSMAVPVTLTDGESTAAETSTAETSTTASSSDPGTTTGDPCEDPGPEPNEIEQDAVDLDDQSCDDFPKTFGGILASDQDVDWYVYQGIYAGFSCSFGDMNPTAVHDLMADPGVRICAFAQCNRGSAVPVCEAGAVNTPSPGGLPGCCHDDTLAFRLDCTESGNESALIYVRLDTAQVNSCSAYAVDYRFSAQF